jgi:mRNA-degrading endonuclease RelE of RelBE toxin-antitoxin system
MRFIETSVFTREVMRLIPEEEYRAIQLALVFRPEQGSLIRGSGGLRKLRWRVRGKGKRGGCRVIYYWDRQTETVYMLLVYPKSDQGDLTPEQARVLGRLVREEFK